MTPLIGQLNIRRVPDAPYEAGVPTLSGKLTFPCCGESWEVYHTRITHVQCPDCGNLYTIALKISLAPSFECPYAKGTVMEITEPFTTKVGAREVTTIPGERYRVGMDAYGLFSVPMGGIVLEFPVMGKKGNRTLLAVAPLSKLKVVEESNVKANSEGNDQDSTTDSGKEHFPAGG